MSKQKSNAKAILLNQMFSGSYLDEGDNIGHEILNLNEDDNNDCYLYITPSGEIKGYRTKDKIVEAGDIESVLFVRNYKKKMIAEVVAVAESVEPFDSSKSTNITYDNKSLEEIFCDNTHKGENEDPDLAKHITFKASGGISIPKKRIFISMLSKEEFPEEYAPENSEVVYISLSERKTLLNQSMRTYILDGTDAHCRIKGIISNKSFWKKPDKNSNKLLFQDSKRPSFLEIINKADSELVFSNLLAYYFKLNRNCFVKFAEEVLELKRNPLAIQEDFKVIRESKSNIDLWIEDDNNIIVIENKIKADIRIYKDENGKDTSQLEKYYEFANKDEERKGRTVSCFLFVPDYNEKKLDSYKGGSHYKQIKYSELYRFFKYNENQYHDPYFKDFLKGLQRHTMMPAELNFEIMKSRFLNKTNEA